MHHLTYEEDDLIRFFCDQMKKEAFCFFYIQKYEIVLINTYFMYTLLKICKIYKKTDILKEICNVCVCVRRFKI